MKTAFLALALGLGLQVTGEPPITHVDKPPAKARPGAPLGLLLTFHGANGNASSLVGKAEEMLQKAGCRDEYVVIGLKSKEAGWTEKDDEPVRAFVPWALKRYNVDPRRVYGFGVSSGAWFLNRFAPLNSDLLAGAISYVGGMGRVPTSDAPATHAEIYWVIGHKDDGLPPSRTRPQAEAFIKAGFRTVYREMLDHAHEGPKPPTEEEAIEWMRALRNKRAAPSTADQDFLKKLEASDSSLSTGSTWARLVAIGGPAAAPVVAQALASDRSGLRSAAAQACTQVMFDGAVVDALVPLVDDKDAKVKRTALQALTFQGRWAYPQAQAALCGVARDEKRTSADRRIAAQGLADIVRIDLMGTYLCKDAIRTLVDLLSDRDAGLRQIAFLALKPVHADGLGFNPAASDAARAKAVEAWSAWADKVVGPKS